MGRLEADSYKFGSDHSGSLIFVEKLFSLMASQSYPCNKDTISL
jgi:hypothetical protein